MSLRRYRHVFKLLAATVTLLQLIIYTPRWMGTSRSEVQEKQRRYPLVYKNIHLSAGLGGAWYIPPTWLPKGATPPANLLEAAWVVAEVVNKEPRRYLDLTDIPRIVHQTWKSTNIEHFPIQVLEGIEKWLGYATARETDMAYFMWDDSGVRELLRTVDSGWLQSINDILPQPVEVADVFRVIVCNSIGGVYADVDTLPLRSPTTWVDTADISNWTDTITGLTYGPHGSSNESFHQQQPSRPVSLILGIEADNEEDSDTYWRMGYRFPVQLTQWSLAARPKQPVLNRFLWDFRAKMDNILNQGHGNISSSASAKTTALGKFDPLELTGPVAITKATKDYLTEQTGLRWQGLSGCEDGGRSKVVLDTLILPITGFSPGRSRYGNMGSKPPSHADARVQHHAQGSWKNFNLEVEVGKLCRTLFGLCRDWSKVQDG